MKLPFRRMAVGLLLLAAMNGRADRTPVIFVTIPPQRWLVEQLAGDGVEVELLVHPGQNPHTFEPTGRQLTLLAQSQGWLTIGLPFEQTILAKARSMRPDLTEHPMHLAVPRLGASHEGHAGEDDRCAADGADPHIWLSPRNMARMGTNCCRALQSILPARQAELDASLVRLSGVLNALQGTLEKQLAPVTNGTIWVYHPSWAYFAQAFQLRQQAVEAEGREPSARQLARLIGEAKQTRARVLFADPQYDPRPIQALARQIDAQVITLDPLAEDWPANLLRVAEAIGKALGTSSDEQP